MTISSLSDAFNSQLAFQEKYVDQHIQDKLYAQDFSQQYVLEQINNLVEELIELRREMPARKTWSKKRDNPPDWDKAIQEYADCFHFFINIGIGLGLDAYMLFDEYNRKHEENIRRQHEKCTN